MSSFLLVALNKIYKSRDGLTAVSSNTSIMSELSNISKSSLPASIPPGQQQNTANNTAANSANRLSSTSASNRNNSHSGTLAPNSNQINLSNVHKSATIQQQQPHPQQSQQQRSVHHSAQASTTTQNSSNQTLKERMQSNSSRQLQQLATPRPATSLSSNANPNSTSQQQSQSQQSHAATATGVGSEIQRRNTVHYETNRALKKPGQTTQNSTANQAWVMPNRPIRMLPWQMQCITLEENIGQLIGLC